MPPLVTSRREPATARHTATTRTQASHAKAVSAANDESPPLFMNAIGRLAASRIGRSHVSPPAATAYDRATSVAMYSSVKMRAYRRRPRKRACAKRDHFLSMSCGGESRQKKGTVAMTSSVNTQCPIGSQAWMQSAMITTAIVSQAEAEVDHAQPEQQANQRPDETHVHTCTMRGSTRMCSLCSECATRLKTVTWRRDPGPLCSALLSPTDASST